MLCTSPVNDSAGRRVPCGRCMACRVNRGQEWSLRLMHEYDYYKEAVFLTLTYNDVNIVEGGSLVKVDAQNFIKRLRSAIDVEIRYYLVGEYGERTRRPHYHAIVFGIGSKYKKIINECWGMGFVSVGSVERKSINYVTSYVQKKLYGKMAKEEYIGRIAPFALMSKRLGLRWLMDNKDQVLQHMGVRNEGRTVRAPRYYFKKLKEMEEVKDAISNELLNEKVIEKSKELDRIRDAEGLSPLDLLEVDRQSRRQKDIDLRTKMSLRKRDSYI